jgi:hypothetical protein
MRLMRGSAGDAFGDFAFCGFDGLDAQYAFGVGQAVRLMIGLSSAFDELNGRAFDCGWVVRFMVGKM